MSKYTPIMDQSELSAGRTIERLQREIEERDERIGHLKHELAFAKNINAGLQADWEAGKRELATLREQLAEAQRDAERYRWLRLQEEAETGWFKWSRVPNHMRQVDVAIDAALRGEGEKG
jgi:chromosome segregation ATPase